MKIQTLLLVLPALCLAACGTSTPTESANPAENAELAKRVVGVQILSTEGYYMQPCDMLGEEYIRSTFGVGEDVAISEGHEEKGCTFEWAGNKVELSFAGQRPFGSIFRAEYVFDVRYQDKPKVAKVPIGKPEPVVMENPEQTASSSEGEGAGASAGAGTATEGAPESDSASAPTPMAEPAVTKGRYAAVTGLGDKAVWDASTGTMHILYINHIFSVRVESKDSAATRKDRAESISEALLEKISEGEYKKYL